MRLRKYSTGGSVNTPKPFDNSIKGQDAAGAGVGAAVAGTAAGMLPPGVDGTNNFQFTKLGANAFAAGPIAGIAATAVGLGADIWMGANQKKQQKKALIDNGAVLMAQREADSVYAQEGGYNQDLVQFRRGGKMPAYANGGSNIIPNSSMQRAGVQFRKAGVTPTVIGGQGGPTEDNQRMMTPNGPIAVSSGEGAANDDVLNKVARSMGIGFAEYQRSLYPDAESGNVRQYARGGPQGQGPLYPHNYKGNTGVQQAPVVSPEEKVWDKTWVDYAPGNPAYETYRKALLEERGKEVKEGDSFRLWQNAWQITQPSVTGQPAPQFPDGRHKMMPMRQYARGGPGGPGGPPLREQNPFAPTAIPLSSEVSGVTPDAYDLLNPQPPAPQGSLYQQQSPMAPTWQAEVPIDLDATAPLLPDKSASAYMELMRQDPTPLVPASVGNPASPNGKAAQDAAKSVTQSVTDKLNDETKPNTMMNQEELQLNRLNRTARNINLAGSAGSFVYNLLSKRTPGMAPRKLEHKPLDLDTNALKNMLANETKSNMKTAQYSFRGRQNLGAELGIVAAGANQKMANAMQVEQVKNTERQYNNAGENRVRQYNNDAFNQFAQNEVNANNQFRAMKGQILTNNLSAMGQSYGNYVDGQIQLSQMGKQARLWDSYEAFRSGESNDVMSDDDYVYDIRGYRKQRRNERKAANQ